MDTQKIVKIALAVLVVIIIFRMLRGSSSAPSGTLSPEFFSDFDPSANGFETIPPTGATPAPTRAGEGSAGPGVTSVPTGPGVGPAMTMAPTCMSADLLPKPGNKDGSFGEFAPSNPLANQNFLDTQKLIGVDSVGSSLKNANYSLRRDPPITKTNTGPFLGSSISADLLRRPLDC